MDQFTQVSRGFAAALFVLCAAPLPAQVQQDGGLAEIVVTARKVEENLRDVPIAITAFTEQSMKEQGISSLQDIADSTPGFDFASAFGRNDFRPVIRGQSNILGRANAGLFVNGVIIEEGSASLPLAALQRVEVVKGPQSALYGRNTLSGAINYVLKTAGEERVTEASLDLGGRSLARAELHFSGPLTDSLGAAITVAHYERGGEYGNTFPGNALGNARLHGRNRRPADFEHHGSADLRRQRPHRHPGPCDVGEDRRRPVSDGADTGEREQLLHRQFPPGRREGLGTGPAALASGGHPRSKRGDPSTPRATTAAAIGAAKSMWPRCLHDREGAPGLKRSSTPTREPGAIAFGWAFA